MLIILAQSLFEATRISPFAEAPVSHAKLWPRRRSDGETMRRDSGKETESKA